MRSENGVWNVAQYAEGFERHFRKPHVCVQFLKPRRRQIQVSAQISAEQDVNAQSIFQCIIELFILGLRKIGMSADIVDTLDTTQALPLY